MTEYCIHIANLFYLASFLHRDILWLRVLTCVGLAFGVIFFTSCTTPMYGPAGWHIVFLLINFYQIYRLTQERRVTDLTASKVRISSYATADLSREKLINVLAQDISGKVDRRRDLDSISQEELDEEARVLKQLALERLSRREIVNLLTRRMWKPIQRRFEKRRSAGLPATP